MMQYLYCISSEGSLQIPGQTTLAHLAKGEALARTPIHAFHNMPSDDDQTNLPLFRSGRGGRSIMILTWDISINIECLQFQLQQKDIVDVDVISEVLQFPSFFLKKACDSPTAISGDDQLFFNDSNLSSILCDNCIIRLPIVQNL